MLAVFVDGSSSVRREMLLHTRLSLAHYILDLKRWLLFAHIEINFDGFARRFTGLSVETISSVS